MHAPRSAPIRYTFVIPIFNEEAALPLLLARMDQLLDGLDGGAEIMCIDDGSSDASANLLAARADGQPPPPNI